MRIGHGYDAHRLVPGRPLRLGGVEIAYERGLEGHSDGDVLLHAVASALLGACGAGDLGTHFPSEDPSLAGIDSSKLIADAMARAGAAGYALENVDATVVAQVPRLAPYRERMAKEIARQLGADPERVNVKVTSSDELGALGRGEGIAAHAVVLLIEEGGS